MHIFTIHFHIVKKESLKCIQHFLSKCNIYVQRQAVSCIYIPHIDAEKAERFCPPNGSWENDSTDYTPCFFPEMKIFLDKLYGQDGKAAEVS